MLNEHFMRFKLNQFSAFCPELLGQLGILCIRRAGTLLAVRVVLTGSYHVFRDRQMNACLSTLLKYKKLVYLIQVCFSVSSIKLARTVQRMDPDSSGDLNV